MSCNPFSRRTDPCLPSPSCHRTSPQSLYGLCLTAWRQTGSSSLRHYAGVNLCRLESKNHDTVGGRRGCNLLIPRRGICALRHPQLLVSVRAALLVSSWRSGSIPRVCPPSFSLQETLGLILASCAGNRTVGALSRAGPGLLPRRKKEAPAGIKMALARVYELASPPPPPSRDSCTTFQSVASPSRSLHSFILASPRLLP